LTVHLADVEHVISRPVDAVERSGYSSSLAERLAGREAERSRLRVRLSEVQRCLGQTQVDVPLAVVEDFSYNAREALQHGALDDVRALLRSIVVRVAAKVPLPETRPTDPEAGEHGPGDSRARAVCELHAQDRQSGRGRRWTRCATRRPGACERWPQWPCSCPGEVRAEPALLASKGECGLRCGLLLSRRPGCHGGRLW